MVERPIKRSERQTVAEPNNVVEEVRETEPSPVEDISDSASQSPEKRNTPRPSPGKDKTKERSKERSKGKAPEEERTKVNPALMRGPRPTKPKSPVIKATEEATEAASGDEETNSEE